MTRTTIDVATVIYGDLLARGPQRPCNIARRVGLKASTVRSFLCRMEKVGAVKRERTLLWALGEKFNHASRDGCLWALGETSQEASP